MTKPQDTHATPSTQPTPGGQGAGLDQERIERGLRTIRAYDAVRFLRDALTATAQRSTGYDWNADPDGITRIQGHAFEVADKVFADLNKAVSATDALFDHRDWEDEIAIAKATGQ